jgi:tetratricopeptide (TPR) repeat protein
MTQAIDLQTSDLDSQELLQLAIQASQLDRHDQAITYLKRALEKDPTNAKLVYFLSVEHAQIGLYERAIEGMTHSLELDPSMETARLQLGLLYLTFAMAEPAQKTLQPLTLLGDTNAFGCFSRGLCHLIRDEFADCKQELQRGIAANQANSALNDDMRKILDAIQEKVESNLPDLDAARLGERAWLGAYQTDDTQKHQS